MIGPGFIECVATPEAACLSSPGFLFPLVLIAILMAVGFIARRSDVHAYRRTRTRALRISTILLVLALSAVAYFLVFDPATVGSVDTSAAAQTAWAVAVAATGAAIAFLAGTLGFALGGWFAKQPKSKTRANTAAATSARPANLVIAIDGPAASGKGTLAKKVAAHYGLPCLDTGLLYRAVARDVVAAGHRLDDAAAAVTAANNLNANALDDPGLRGPAAGDAASIVARVPDVRKALLAYQRAFAAAPGGAVIDGRDIGTVVCPGATVKLFVTASDEERARRRHLEYQGRGDVVPYDEVLQDIRARDARDQSRAISPLEPAADAIRLDTTALDARETFEAALAAIEGRLAARR